MSSKISRERPYVPIFKRSVTFNSQIIKENNPLSHDCKNLRLSKRLAQLHVCLFLTKN